MSHPYESFMREAAELAERGRWSAAPNPTVGAVLVRDGVVVARGWHTAYGKSHAEVECLKDAEAKGVDPSACTLVVTLEPCNHQGQTPPCTEAVIAAGIRHVVIGLRDPNPKAAGGMERLAEAGVEVEAGVCEELCRDLVADFLIWQTTKRPYVMLKLAMTLDGRIATRTGHSRWITGETARHQVHELRANVGRAGGAILVGGNTLHTDNPLLTARLDDPVERQPLAVSISSRVPAPDSLLRFKERPTETIFFTTASGAATPRAAQLRERGVRIRGLDRWKSGEDLVQILEYLRQEAGCPYVLCEGGGRLGLSLLEAGLVDEFHLHIAPKVLGDNGQGKVLAVESRGHETRFRIQALYDLADIILGESIAVNGTCLTVETSGPSLFSAYASAETMQRTALGLLKPGAKVNLERALAVGDRLGGHIVSGHVDCVAEILSVRREGESRRIRIGFPASFGAEVIGKGSVALDGISLTVNDCGPDFLEVNVIPETWRATTVAEWAPGTRINMETDVIGKYVRHMVAPHLGLASEEAKAGKLSVEFLRENGFF